MSIDPQENKLKGKDHVPVFPAFSKLFDAWSRMNEGSEPYEIVRKLSS